MLSLPRAHRRPLGRLVLGLLVLFATALAPAPAIAVGLGSNVSPSTSGYSSRSGNVYYAYVEEGEWIYAWGNGGTATVYGPDGTEWAGSWSNASFTVARQATQDGVWTLSYGGSSNWFIGVYSGDPGFDGTGTSTDPATLTPATGAVEAPGRVWTEEYAIHQTGGSSQVKEIAFWMLNDSGYEYRLRLRDYNGVDSSISATSLGIPDDGIEGESCAPSYRSWEHDAGADGFPDRPDCAVPYRLFFEQPSDDLPSAAAIAPTDFNDQRTTQVIRPNPVDPTEVDADDFVFDPVAPGAAAGTFRYDLGDNFFGGALLQVDVDGNGTFDDPVDRTLRVGAAGGPATAAFNGVDGQGDPIAACTPLDARLYLDRIGEVHVVQTDVEGRSIEVTRVSGPDAPDATIHWDDSATGPRSNEINPPDGISSLDGTDSTGGAHGWDYSTSSWGNNKIIDDWSYVPADTVAGTLAIPARCLEISKTASTDAPATGDTVTYTVEAENTGATGYDAANPAQIADDLSGVMDDADVVPGSLRATVDGDPVTAPQLTGDRLTWSGPLAAGKTVVLTYQVTIKTGGDLQGRNLAFVVPPGDDPDDQDPPEECVDGVAEDGTPCDTTTFRVPRDPALSIDKSSTLLIDANSDGLADTDDVVRYSFTVRNEGNTTLTGVHPVDAKVSGITPGPVTLAPGQQQVFTADYTVTQADVDAGAVVNVATATGEDPENGTVNSPPDDDRVDGPDPDPNLTIHKSAALTVDEGTPDRADVDDVITYTFRVHNDGPATAFDIAVTDPLAGLSPVAPATVTSLAPGEDAYFEATYTVTQADVDRGQVANQATATFLPPEDPDNPGTPPERSTPPSDLVIVETPDADPGLSIDKSSQLDDSNGNGRADVGETIVYTFEVANTGNVTVLGATVDDDRIDGLSPARVNLGPGEHATFTSDPYTVTQADVDAGEVVNQATATGTTTNGGDVVSDPDTDRTPGPDHDPSLSIEKSARLADANDNDKADRGETITYRFSVTNTGNVTLRDVRVVDPRVSGLDPVTVDELAPGETVRFQAAPYTVTAADVRAGSVANTATAFGVPPNGGSVSDDDTVTTDVNDPGPQGDGSTLPGAGSPLSLGLLGIAFGLCVAGTLLARRRITGGDQLV